MQRKTVIIPALLLAVIACAALFLYSTGSRKEPDRIKASGNVEATTVTAAFKVGGRLSVRLLDEGEQVKKGQTLARLESEDFAEELSLRRAELNGAEAFLAELEAGSRKEDVAQAQAALERTEAEAARLKADLVRNEELYRREIIAARDFDSARTAMLSSQAQVREAQERLKLLRNGPRPEAIRQARAKAEGSRAALKLAMNRLEDATLVSPATGTVLAKHAEPGELVNPGTPIVTIGDLRNIWIRVFIPEASLGRIKLGRTAKVFSDSFPGKSYTGTVSFIASEAEFTPKNVQTEKERVKLVFRVKVSVDNPEQELKPGMPVDVIFPAE